MFNLNIFCLPVMPAQIYGRYILPKSRFTFIKNVNIQNSLLWHQPIPFFLLFPELHLHFHHVKWFFNFFFIIFTEKLPPFFFTIKKDDFLTKMVKTIFYPHIYIGIFSFNYEISRLWEIFWSSIHVCRSKIGNAENLSLIFHIFEYSKPWGCYWRGYATQEADQELK